MAKDVPNVRAVNPASVVTDAIGRATVSKDSRVVHICLLGTHVHPICEADGPVELANGMRSMNGTIASALNGRLSSASAAPATQLRSVHPNSSTSVVIHMKNIQLLHIDRCLVSHEELVAHQRLIQMIAAHPCQKALFAS